MPAVPRRMACLHQKLAWTCSSPRKAGRMSACSPRPISAITSTASRLRTILRPVSAVIPTSLTPKSCRARSGPTSSTIP
jgi:hypothetical protein